MARRVIITGGASGIGRVMAEAFLKLGDRVAVCDTSETEIFKLRSSCPEIFITKADVSDEESMEQFFEIVTCEFGGVDVFISNAGIAGPAGPIQALDLSEWRSCIAVNLDGAFLSCRWAAKQMQEQKNGVIILISSTSGLYGVPFRSPYVTAKWGIIGLMKTLAIELGGANIRVNAICPGSIEGERIERVLNMESEASGRKLEDVRAQYMSGVSLRCFMTAQDISDMAVFLASDAARHVTGQAVSVDGNTERMV